MNHSKMNENIICASFLLDRFLFLDLIYSVNSTKSYPFIRCRIVVPNTSCSILQSTQLSWFRFLTLSLFLWPLWLLSLSSFSLISLSSMLFSMFSRRLFSTLSFLMLRSLSDVARTRIVFDASRSKSRASDKKTLSVDDVRDRRTFVSR
jgi:hypothetical protein